MTAAVHLCGDRRREQQRQLATYVGVNDGDEVRFGDTRLGEDTSGMEALMHRELSRQQSGQKQEGGKRKGTVRTRVNQREEGVQQRRGGGTQSERETEGTDITTRRGQRRNESWSSAGAVNQKPPSRSPCSGQRSAEERGEPAIR